MTSHARDPAVGPNGKLFPSLVSALAAIILILAGLGYADVSSRIRDTREESRAVSTTVQGHAQRIARLEATLEEIRRLNERTERLIQEHAVLTKTEMDRIVTACR